MARNDSHETAIHDFVKLLIGLVLGSGIAGASVRMVHETPDARIWGIAILAGCILAALLTWFVGELFIGRLERRRLDKLSNAYVRALNVMGQRLVDKIDTASAQGQVEVGKIRPFVLNMLAELLETQLMEYQGEEEETEWAKAYKAGLKITVGAWTGLAAAEQKEGHCPYDAMPEKIP